MPCIFQNVRSLGNPELRAALLRGLHTEFDVVALAETFASPDDEQTWAKDWPSGHVHWGSAQSGTTRSRGVALLFSQNLHLSDQVTHSDGTGHLLVVQATLFERHRFAFVVSHALCGSAAENAGFFRQLMFAIYIAF